jgi:hypothetical protein
MFPLLPIVQIVSFGQLLSRRNTIHYGGCFAVKNHFNPDDDASIHLSKTQV